MSSDLPDDLTHVRAAIEKAWQTYGQAADAVAACHPSWRAQHDARYGVFKKCANVLMAVHLAAWFCTSRSVNEAWREAYESGVTPTYPPQTAEMFGTFVRKGMMEFLYSAVESSFRVFLRSLNPSACSEATGSFESVYVCLLSRLDKRKWERLLKLWRLCRNTCHNNGVYLPRKGDSEEVAFEGTTYRFEKGKLVRYGDWDTLIRVATRACDMLVDIVMTPQLSALPRSHLKSREGVC